MPVRGNCGVSGWSLNSGKGIEGGGTGPVDGTAGEERRPKRWWRKRKEMKEVRMTTDLSTYEV